MDILAYNTFERYSSKHYTGVFNCSIFIFCNTFESGPVSRATLPCYTNTSLRRRHRNEFQTFI